MNKLIPSLILAFHVMGAWIVKISILSNDCFCQNICLRCIFLAIISLMLLSVNRCVASQARIRRSTKEILDCRKETIKERKTRFLDHFIWHDCSTFENVTSSEQTIGYVFQAISLKYRNSMRGQRKKEKREQSTFHWGQKNSRLHSQNHQAYDRQQFNQRPSNCKSRNSTLLLMLESAFGIGLKLTLSKLHYFCDKRGMQITGCFIRFRP